MSKNDLRLQFESIIAAAYPPFIYVQDLSDANVARDAIHQAAASATEETSSAAIACIDCISCFSQRLLFDTVLNALVRARPERKIETIVRNDTVDDFLHNLQDLFRDSSSSNQPTIVIVFDHAEKLREMNARLVHPLSRLQELTSLNVVSVFISRTEWESIAIVGGSLFDPYRITIDQLSKEDVVAQIQSRFPTDVKPDDLSIYNPSLATLFSHFVEAVCSVCFPFTTDADELSYFVCVRWPGFVAPIVEEWVIQDDGNCSPPSEDVRIRLLRLFNPTLTSAIEHLYPRSMDRAEWASRHSLSEGSHLTQPQGLQLFLNKSIADSKKDPNLNVLAMFVVVAAFLASYNPVKTDFRMFGRGVDERARRRKKGGGTRKTKASTAAKLPQRLVGPISFTYDRLIAILSSLLREYDMGQELETQSELNAETEAYRAQTSAIIRELIACQYIHRATAQDKLDSLSYRCGLGYEPVLVLARKLGIPLGELMLEPN